MSEESYQSAAGHNRRQLDDDEDERSALVSMVLAVVVGLFASGVLFFASITYMPSGMSSPVNNTVAAPPPDKYPFGITIGAR